MRLRRWLNRKFDAAFGRFSVGRAVRLLSCGAAVLLVVTITTLPAFADPVSGGLGGFAIFDVTDSRGIRVSQYELSLDTGGITAPVKIWLSQRLLTGWNLYRYSISFVAYLVDWTINMSWLGLITDPIDRVAQQIRNQLITPVGLAGFMLVVSAAVGGIRMVFGRMGKGLWDVLSACVVAALAAGLLANPVATFTGDPLTKARHVGVAVANMITSDGTLANTNLNQPPGTGDLHVGQTLIDTMIRPAHGLINYGVNFTGDQKCTGAYDTALKAGPYWDPDATKTREAVGKCDKKLGEFADYSIYTASSSMGVFLVTGALMCALIVTVCALLFISVMMLTWTLLKLVLTTVIGIGPGDTRGPLIRNAAHAVVSLVYVASSMIALAVVMAVINRAFAARNTYPLLRFLVVDMIVVGGYVLVVQTWTAHRRGAQSWAEKLMTRMKQTVPKPTISSKVGGWLKGPVGGQASVYGDLGGAAFAGAGGGGSGRRTGTGMTVGRMLRPVTNSNAFAIAKFAGVTAATGGAGAVAGAAATVKGAARTVQVANTVRRTYAATQQGARHVTSGNRTLDVAIDQTSRAHTWLQTKAVQAHQSGFDALEHTGNKVRKEAPAAVMTAVGGLLGPTVQKVPPTAEQNHSQPYIRTRPVTDRQLISDRAAPSPDRRPGAARIVAGNQSPTPASSLNSDNIARPARPQTPATAAPPRLEPTDSAAARVLKLVQPTPTRRPRGGDQTRPPTR